MTTEFRVNLPDWLEPDDYAEFAENAIIHIINRTLDGKGCRPRGRGYSEYNMTSETPYTEEYAKRKGQTHVDLMLKGEMLNSMDYSIRGSSLYIGYMNAGRKLKGKVEGNQARRPFLGLKKAEIDLLASEFKQEE